MTLQKAENKFMSGHLNAQHDDEPRQWICIVRSIVFWKLKFQWISRSSTLPSLRGKQISPSSSRRRKQQSVAGADLKQTEINYVSMREPKKILKCRERKFVVLCIINFI